MISELQLSHITVGGVLSGTTHFVVDGSPQLANYPVAYLQTHVCFTILCVICLADGIAHRGARNIFPKAGFRLRYRKFRPPLYRNMTRLPFARQAVLGDCMRENERKKSKGWRTTKLFVSTAEYIPNECLNAEYLPNERLTSELIPNKCLTSEHMQNESLTSEYVPNECLTSEYISNECLTSEYTPNEYLASEYIPNEWAHLQVFRAVGIFRPRLTEQGKSGFEHSGCRRSPSAVAKPRSLQTGWSYTIRTCYTLRVLC